VVTTRFVHSNLLSRSGEKWELDKGDESLAIAVNGSLILDELDVVIQAALDAAGLAALITTLRMETSIG
jgi:hypothetical protein